MLLNCVGWAWQRTAAAAARTPCLLGTCCLRRRSTARVQLLLLLPLLGHPLLPLLRLLLLLPRLLLLSAQPHWPMLAVHGPLVLATQQQQQQQMHGHHSLRRQASSHCTNHQAQVQSGRLAHQCWHVVAAKPLLMADECCSWARAALHWCGGRTAWLRHAAGKVLLLARQIEVAAWICAVAGPASNVELE